MNPKVLLISSDTSQLNILKNYLLENRYILNECPLIENKIQQAILVLSPNIVVFYCERAQPSLVTTIKHLQEAMPKPLIVFTDHSDENRVADSIIAGASAFVVDGIEAHRIRPIIEAASARFAKCQSMKRQLSEASVRLDERRDIDRAKGILMQHKNMNEEQAYQFLRKMAMNKNQRIGQIAQSLVEMARMLQ